MKGGAWKTEKEEEVLTAAVWLNSTDGSWGPRVVEEEAGKQRLVIKKLYSTEPMAHQNCCVGG